MEEKQFEDQALPAVPEPLVTFKSMSDRILYTVRNPEINENLIEISGYDLDVVFNLKYLNSVTDIENACQGVADLFRQLIADQLIKAKSDKQNK